MPLYKHHERKNFDTGFQRQMRMPTPDNDRSYRLAKKYGAVTVSYVPDADAVVVSSLHISDTVSGDSSELAKPEISDLAAFHDADRTEGLLPDSWTSEIAHMFKEYALAEHHLHASNVGCRKPNHQLSDGSDKY